MFVLVQAIGAEERANAEAHLMGVRRSPQPYEFCKYAWRDIDGAYNEDFQLL